MAQAELLVIVPFWIVTSPFVRKYGKLLPNDKVLPFRSMVMFASVSYTHLKDLVFEFPAPIARQAVVFQAQCKQMRKIVPPRQHGHTRQHGRITELSLIHIFPHQTAA